MNVQFFRVINPSQKLLGLFVTYIKHTVILACDGDS